MLIRVSYGSEFESDVRFKICNIIFMKVCTYMPTLLGGCRYHAASQAIHIDNNGADVSKYML